MKPKNCFNLFTALLALCIFLTCCKKGDTGPAGPAGANGAAGPAGPAGPAGAKGDTGTANVIYSAWLDVNYLPDTFRAAGNVLDTAGFFANITAAKLTNAIINSGEMKVYMNFGTTATPDVVPLPYIDVYSGLSITPDFLVGRIYLYSNANASTTLSGGLKYLQYRYILIPGAVPARMTQKVNLNNYKDVKAFYNLPD